MLSLTRTLDFNAEAGIDARAEAKIPAKTADGKGQTSSAGLLCR